MVTRLDGLGAIDFSEAKSHLSDLMSTVVRDHQPRLVSRHRGKESMLLLNTQDVLALLRQYRFESGVIFSDGEVTIEMPQLGLLGFGDTFHEALADLLNELRVYAQRYFERPSFYLQSDRRAHLPWLLRFVLTPPDEQLSLLTEPPADLQVP